MASLVVYRLIRIISYTVVPESQHLRSHIHEKNRYFLP